MAAAICDGRNTEMHNLSEISDKAVRALARVEPIGARGGTDQMFARECAQLCLIGNGNYRFCVMNQRMHLGLRLCSRATALLHVRPRATEFWRLPICQFAGK